jgi:hypothetical protein
LQCSSKWEHTFTSVEQILASLFLVFSFYFD